jgi:hypothetical protein
VSPLTFLAIPLVIVTVGCLWLWARSRRPNTLDSGIDDFQREMRALSPENDRYRARRGTERSSERGQRDGQG